MSDTPNPLSLDYDGLTTCDKHPDKLWSGAHPSGSGLVESCETDCPGPGIPLAESLKLLGELRSASQPRPSTPNFLGHEYVDIVFDGPPSNPAPRFVEVENPDGSGVNLGEWVERDDGYWVLRITDVDALKHFFINYG